MGMSQSTTAKGNFIKYTKTACAKKRPMQFSALSSRSPAKMASISAFLLSQRGLRSAAIAALLFFAVTTPGGADTVTVTNTNDSGPGSLRQALSIVNDGDTIDFSVTGTITLTSGELLVNDSITILGPGATDLAVNGNQASRVFHVGSGRAVTISGLTIANGFIDFGDSGGGIYNDHGTLTIDGCTMTGNSGGSGGGAVYNDGTFGSATLNVAGSDLSGNSGFDGGAIFSNGFSGNATVNVDATTIADNSGQEAGGIYSQGGGGQTGNAMLTISDSTFSNNSGEFTGGAVYSNGSGSGMATLRISNSTFSGNSAVNLNGGAIYNDGSNGSATAQVSNTTFSGNTAGDTGGGIFNSGSSGIATVEIGDTVLNAGAVGANIANESGTITSHGYNVSSDNGGGYLTGPGDQTNTNPMLGPLQDNGGPTFTHALQQGSPAIDSGDPNFTPPPFDDQRGPGYPRVVNGRIDKGSFEVQTGGTPTPTPTATPTATATATSTPSPTPTSTPSTTPRATPTPRIRPTPARRPASPPSLVRITPAPRLWFERLLE
jgi:predicted outer membrane repeat protein